MKQELFSQDAQWCIYGIGFFDPVIKDIPEFRMLPPLSENGIFLGFDLYGFEGNSLCCPFRHCDMKNKIPLKLGIMPNDFGLIANIEGANKLADYVNENKLGEPEEYIPFGIVRYGESL